MYEFLTPPKNLLELLGSFQISLIPVDIHSGKLTYSNEKWTRIEDVFPSENGGYSSQPC